MMNFGRYRGWGMVLATLFSMNTLAQIVKHERMFSFEGAEVPTEVAGSQVSISGKHYKDGKHSLCWKFRSNEELTIRKDLHFEPKDATGKDLYLSAFIVWIYNEQAQDEQITFQFLKDGKLCSSFPMGINFTGWRGAWVCYERDMQGTPQEGMNEIRIKAPDVDGKLYIDHLITATKVDARQQTADVQVPFVNKGTTNHWLVIYEHSLWKPDIPLEAVSERDREEMQLIETRFRDMLYTPSRLTDKELKQIREAYNAYGIDYRNGVVTGLPIFMVRQAEAYERMIPNWNKDMFSALGMEMKEYFDLMKRIAVAFHNASEPTVCSELKEMFLSMYEHITDQGVAYGSCWGNIHHYGYSMRGLYVAYFLMKEVLQEAGKLAEAERTLRWYAITNEVYPKPEKWGIDMDSFNTQTQGRMASILIMEDTPEKLQYLRSFSRWIDYGCRPASGLGGAFKKDGAAFHHRNHYPAYAVGGLEGATNMIYLLSGTRFRVSELAHETVKKVLLTMRFYCNLKQWPLSLSGRHPNGKGQLIPAHYAVLAMAGSPDGNQVYDPQLAEAFLRLVNNPTEKSHNAPDYLPKTSARREQQWKELFLQRGFKPEADPQGNMALGYGCISIQRRDNWAAVVRGHSRYLWASEHYLPANFYGRYLAHGSMQLLTGKENEVVTLSTSGWQEEGFDWNRIPGTTSIHLPFNQLRARVLNVDRFSGMEEMLFSDEAFAGGLSQAGRNGNFGMKLHEHDKYNGSHRARKSYHFFENVIVCLGSDIENENKEYPTETTIFQLAVTSPEQKEYWNSINAKGSSFIDSNGVGYYVPKALKKRLLFERNFPQITAGERSSKPTVGDWVSLTIQHGKAPMKGSYEYAVLPRTDTASLSDFVRNPSYRVLQKDNMAHIVCSSEGHASYVLFETPEELPNEGLLQKVDTSCLVMTHLQEDKLLLTVCQPDLALYRGPADEIYDLNGKRIERSIYSRPWIDNDSGEIPVTITLKGHWELQKDVPNCHVTDSNEQYTSLRFLCKDAASYDVCLQKVLIRDSEKSE